MGVTLSTLVGWTVVFAVGGFFVHRGHTKDRRSISAKKVGQRLKEEQRNLPQARRDTKEREKETKARRRTIEASEKDRPQQRQQQQQQSQPASRKDATGQSSDDDDLNNREFAKQLSSAKQGTKFTVKSRDDVRHKSVKQSRAEEGTSRAEAGDHQVSAPSSTAGIDADDDQSSIAQSPVVGAVHDAGDVSDMLENRAPGPSVLRLTSTENNKQKPNAQKAPAEQAETKKQRQRRKQAEAAKIANQEAEAERKVRMEAHRRRVREAEGRPAMDGSGFMAAQARGGVWMGNGAGANGQSNGVNGFLPVQPLDTAGVTTTNAASATSTESSGAPASAPTTGDGDWLTTLPSEEEQMELLRRNESSWSTVPTKGRKPKKKDSPTESNDDTDAGQATPQHRTKKPDAADSAPSAPHGDKRPVKAFSQMSSFAALSSDGPADQEEEEEWDV